MPRLMVPVSMRMTNGIRVAGDRSVLASAGTALRIGKRVQFLVRAADTHESSARGDRKAVRVERRAQRGATLQLELVRPADEGLLLRSEKIGPVIGWLTTVSFALPFLRGGRGERVRSIGRDR